jgi:glycosyltransferase involved in cell wall biosynthesis
MDKPFFSVVMPVYNGLPHLVEALESLEKQTFRDFELIAVDDLSQDASFAYLRDFSGKAGFRMSVVQVPAKPDICLARVRNLGLHHARGEWISFMDQDDVWMPEKMARHRQIALERPDIGFIHNDRIVFDASGPLDNGHIAGHPTLTADKVSGQCFETLFEGNFVCMSCASLPRRHFDELGLMDENLAAVDDYDIWLRVAAKYEVAFIRDPLTGYRHHANNMSKMDILVDVDTVKALKKAAGQFPHLVTKSHLNQRLHYLHHDLGERLLERGEVKEARHHFLQAALAMPRSLGAWWRSLRAVLAPSQVQKARSMLALGLETGCML